QTVIARRVTLAHQEIPSAFAAIKIYCDRALQARATYIENNGIVIGLPEMFVKHLGEMQMSYPGFYQDREPGTDGKPETGVKPNVGITVDVGTGLYIPVIKNVLDKSLADIADEMMEFRLKALRQTFKEEELSGGHITLSLHTENDITLAIPIIFPTQTCILSLCSVQEELYLDQAESVSLRHYCNLGITYDHRSINGAAAVQFLQTLKSSIETLKIPGEEPGTRTANEDALS
ncbi:MAG TPA: 2-oxo acid dehydrogenase subunit E2, partial [Ktedonobacteraceae bacterium]|nr:2-oxo acid dehydrogenase subunit E2 [Ktedonobacteraceae bacterium]